jgi:hypothetical protein
MANQDISRWLQQTRKHYAAARLQQARVLLDSDPNEGGIVFTEQRRRALVDAIGPKGAPAQGFTIRQPLDGSGNEPGVLQVGDVITALSASFNGETPPVDVLSLAIGSGSLYVGGLRVDMDQAESVAFQRDFLQEVPAANSTVMPLFSPDFRNLYYLRVWEQGVSSVEDQEAQEVMLRAGRDSSFRIRRMRRVEVLSLPAGITTCNDAWTNLLNNHLLLANATFDERNDELRSLGMLQLVFSGGEAADACSPTPPSDPLGKRYLGAENQTLRILLTSDSSYVWALDNATPLFKVQVDGLNDPSHGVTVTILNPPTDERSMPFANRVVEIIPFGALLEGGDLAGADPLFRKVTAEVGVFTRISGPYDPVKHTFALELTNTVTTNLQNLVHIWDPNNHPFAAELNAPTTPLDQRFFYMRLWHDAATPNGIEIHTSNNPNGAPLGDTGIVPVFVHDGQAGDYWVATLRVDSPDRIQPFDLVSPAGMPPAGPRRFYAPLALIAGQAVSGAPLSTEIIQVEDCRPRIRPLSDRGCATLIVGDGIHSFGDFTSIQDALDALGIDGGTVAVRPGVYDGPITVKGSNVSLEGCGDATVVRTTGTSAGSALLTITGASNVRVSGFKLQAAGESAVKVNGSSNGVDIGSMHLVSGTFDNGAFTQFGTADFGQVVIADKSTDVTLHDSVLEPNRQPGIVLGGTSAGSASNVTLTRLNILGSLTLENNDASPLVHIDDQSVNVLLSDSTLEPRGQHGVFVSLGASQILLDRLTVNVHAQQGSSGGGPSRLVTRARPAVMASFAGSANLTLRRSRIVVDDTPTDHAAIVAGGDGITIEENHVETLGSGTQPSQAWGGIQILSNSQSIRVTGNEILGGYGHGITLGSVLWVNSNDQNEVLVNFNFQGAGAGQTQGGIGGSSLVNGRLTNLIINSPITGLRTHYVPNPFRGIAPGISDIVIADNRIEGMSTNGISAVTVLGLADESLPEIEGIYIERNVITGNLKNLAANILNSTPLPLTASTFFMRIQLPRIPFGGIVLATATEAHIRDNAIINNATGTATGVLPINGVFVLNGDSIDIDGNRILGNGVRAPAREPPFVRVGPRAGIAVMLCGTSTASGPTSTIPNLVDFLTNSTSNPDDGGVSLRVTNNTVNHPEGRALIAIATGPVHIEGNYLASQGNAGGDSTSEQFQVGDLVYVQNLGGPWERFQLDANESDAFQNFTMPVNAMPTLLNQISESPYRYIGDGGGVLFNNNQTVLDWTVQRRPTVAGAPLAFFPVVLATLDHLGMLGNQMSLRIDNVPANLPSPLPDDPEVTEPVLSHLLALAMTLKVELNRFSENVKSVFLSIMARADLMNSTAFNQSTHDIFSIRQVRQDDFLDVFNNQVLFLRSPPIQDTDSLRAELKDMFGLLFPIK